MEPVFSPKVPYFRVHGFSEWARAMVLLLCKAGKGRGLGPQDEHGVLRGRLTRMGNREPSPLKVGLYLKVASCGRRTARSEGNMSIDGLQVTRQGPLRLNILVFSVGSGQHNARCRLTVKL